MHICDFFGTDTYPTPKPKRRVFERQRSHPKERGLACHHRLENGAYVEAVATVREDLLMV